MVSYKYFSEINLPLPVIEEQSRISGYISSIENKIQIIQQLIDKSESWKKGLLQKMFC